MKPKVRAALYVRTSTEQPQYSTEKQAEVIRDHSAKHGFEVVRTVEDAGERGHDR